MADKLVYIPIDDKQNYTSFLLQLLVETFGHTTRLNNKSKFYKSPQGCEALIIEAKVILLG